MVNKNFLIQIPWGWNWEGNFFCLLLFIKKRKCSKVSTFHRISLKSITTKLSIKLGVVYITTTTTTSSQHTHRKKFICKTKKGNEQTEITLEAFECSYRCEFSSEFPLIGFYWAISCIDLLWSHNEFSDGLFKLS